MSYDFDLEKYVAERTSVYILLCENYLKMPGKYFADLVISISIDKLQNSKLLFKYLNISKIQTTDKVR